MKYIRTYESFKEKRNNQEPVNEEFIGKLLASATGALKNFLGNITAPFKALKDDFKKSMKIEDVKKKMSGAVDTILKSASDSINKAEDENAINQIKDAFRKEIDEKVLEFDKEIKAVKESVLNESVKDTMIGARVLMGMLKDTALKFKEEYDKKFAAAKDLAAKKAVAVEEIKKIAEEFKKKIADESAFKAAEEKYMTDNKIEDGGEQKGLIELDWGKKMSIFPISKDSPTGKKYPGYFQIVKSESDKLKVEDKNDLVLAKIEGEVKKGQKVKLTDLMRNDKPDPLKEYETGNLQKITVDGKEVEEYKPEGKAPGQEDLVKKLGELKTKKPEDIKKVSSYVDFISDEKNKDKITEIEKIIGGGE